MEELPDYIFDVDKIMGRLSDLNVREHELQQEMDGANELDLGLIGPERAAAQGLVGVERSRERWLAALELAKKGYDLWDAWGFEHTATLDSTWLNWHELSEVLTDNVSSGNPKATIRMPLEAQGKYGKAHLGGGFRSFVVAETFETVEVMDDLSGKVDSVALRPFSYYLLGRADSKALVEKEDLFFITGWESND